MRHIGQVLLRAPFAFQQALGIGGYSRVRLIEQQGELAEVVNLGVGSGGVAGVLTYLLGSATQAPKP